MRVAWVVKYFANAYTPSGIPDLLCCVNGQFVAVEVKAQNGKPSPLQHFNCDEIIDAGEDAFILYPSGFEKFKENIHRLKNKQGLAYPEKNPEIRREVKDEGTKRRGQRTSVSSKA